jgi:hypothetical protein
MPRKQYFFLLVILPLVAGALVYLLLRNNTWLHHTFGFNPQHPVAAAQGFFGQLLAYQLPDFCWSLSFAACLFLFQSRLGLSAKMIAPLAFILLIVAEFVQYLFPGSFTFDWMDVGAAIIAFLVSYFTKPSAT